MSTMHTRSRRFLSMGRRDGIQVTADVVEGVTPRHAQGWRDINYPSEPLDAGAGIIHAMVVGMCAWLLIALAVVGAVALLG